MKLTLRLLLLLSFLILPLWTGAQDQKEIRLEEKAGNRLEDFGPWFREYGHMGTFVLDSIRAIASDKVLRLYFNREVSHIPLRESLILGESTRIKAHLGRYFRKYQLELFSGQIPLADLVPNYYRELLPVDSTRFPMNDKNNVLFFRRNEPQFKSGLSGNHIALWHSHGRYYEAKLDRWEWQRARIHTTVEDMLPMSYVLPYLEPMLKNAGAITLLPRERDWQKNEVIVDNDTSFIGSKLELNEAAYDFERKAASGFFWKDRYLGEENPFRLGSYMEAMAKEYPDESQSRWVARYIPWFPENGTYAVYISYGANPLSLSPVEYRIHSQQGEDVIMVDQSIGAGTWIYLGHYNFEKGSDPAQGSIELSSQDVAALVTLDAVKFGGGMGNIARRPDQTGNKISAAKKIIGDTGSPGAGDLSGKYLWKTSGDARYLEAARYYLQYAGMPDSLVFKLNEGTEEYKDDYQCRGEWVNYLVGSPSGPEKDRMTPGLGIPIDLAFAFHTDAGVTPNDSVIGTLGIYSADADQGYFPNGRSRQVNRELTDIIQTQIISDIRSLANPEWTHRGIWNKAYSEAYRANVPTMLLELHSHQNLADMVFGLDPRFRFLVSRAIYKGMLRFLAFQENREYVIQPLAIDHFQMEHLGGKRIRLSWQPVADPIEPTAHPDYYHLYIRENEGSFRVLEAAWDSTSYVLELPEYEKIYSFRIEAVNAGGRSFPSEILAAGFHEGQDSTVLIVNAFDRLCGPSVVDTAGFAGIAFWDDQGVPDGQDISTTGMPYDFDRQSPWLDDDSPGWGASHADREGRVVPGNRFDYPYLHGSSIFMHGLSFISTSDESFASNTIQPQSFVFIDLLFGEERSTKNLTMGSSEFKVFNPEVLSRISATLEMGIPVLISGAYVGTDMVASGDSIAIQFAREKLHYSWRSNHADRLGMVYGTDDSGTLRGKEFSYNTGFHPDHYTVEAPDAIEPVGEQARTILRYQGNRSSAAIASNGPGPNTVVLGFPFETVLSDSARNALMGHLIRLLLQQQ